MLIIDRRKLLFSVLLFSAFFAVSCGPATPDAPPAVTAATVGISVKAPEKVAEASANDASETETEALTEAVTETPPETAPETTTEVVPEPAVVSIPRFYDFTESEATELLTSYGLTVVSEYENGAVPASTVLDLSFYGSYDDDYLYINEGSTVTLWVSQRKKPAVDPEAWKGKRIYLTFDDGPSKEKTSEVLDILGAYDVKATFFLVGRYVDYYNKSVKAISEAGHAIGCHSYTHSFKDLYKSADSFSSEIETWETSIKKALGELPENKLFRFPGGSCEADNYAEVYGSMLDILDEKGYLAFDWTMTNNDVWSKTKNGKLTPDEYVKSSFLRMLDKREAYSTQPKVVLMHETNAYTVDMLEWAIKLLIERGYTFGTLDELDASLFM